MLSTFKSYILLVNSCTNYSLKKSALRDETRRKIKTFATIKVLRSAAHKYKLKKIKNLISDNRMFPENYLQNHNNISHDVVPQVPNQHIM